MINAKEARELVEQSDATVKKRLDRINAVIRAEASLGKREVLLKDHSTNLSLLLFNVWSRLNLKK
jgi:hypothetical protein